MFFLNLAVLILLRPLLSSAAWLPDFLAACRSAVSKAEALAAWRFFLSRASNRAFWHASHHKRLLGCPCPGPSIFFSRSELLRVFQRLNSSHFPCGEVAFIRTLYGWVFFSLVSSFRACMASEASYHISKNFPRQKLLFLHLAMEASVIIQNSYTIFFQR